MSSMALALPGARGTQSTSQAMTPTNQQKPLPSSPSAQGQKTQAPQTPRTSTPVLQTQPGTWRHPHVDDIIRRQNAAVFNGENVRHAIHHAIFFFTSLLAPNVLGSYQPLSLILKGPLTPYRDMTINLIRLFFFFSFLFCFRPFLQKQDEMGDIPLTPAQRALLGLNPSGTPVTPGSQFITPPRYSRSATPRSSVSERDGRSPAGSPSEGRGMSGSIGGGHTRQGRGASGSPYSPSPLIQKALTGSASRRPSMDFAANGQSGPLNLGASTGRASVGLNNKWLYERGRSSPGTGKNLFS